MISYRTDAKSLAIANQESIALAPRTISNSFGVTFNALHKGSITCMEGSRSWLKYREILPRSMPVNSESSLKEAIPSFFIRSRSQLFDSLAVNLLSI